MALDASEMLDFIINQMDAARNFSLFFYIPLHDAPASLSSVIAQLTEKMPAQGNPTSKISRLTLVHGWVPPTMGDLGIEFQSHEENKVRHLEVWTPWRRPESPEDGFRFLFRRALDTMLTAKGFESVTVKHYLRSENVHRHSSRPVHNPSLQQLVNSQMVTIGRETFQDVN